MHRSDRPLHHLTIRLRELLVAKRIAQLIDRAGKLERELVTVVHGSARIHTDVE